MCALAAGGAFFRGGMAGMRQPAARLPAGRLPAVTPRAVTHLNSNKALSTHVNPRALALRDTTSQVSQVHERVPMRGPILNASLTSTGRPPRTLTTHAGRTMDLQQHYDTLVSQYHGKNHAVSPIVIDSKAMSTLAREALQAGRPSCEETAAKTNEFSLEQTLLNILRENRSEFGGMGRLFGREFLDDPRAAQVQGKVEATAAENVPPAHDELLLSAHQQEASKALEKMLRDIPEDQRTPEINEHLEKVESEEGGSNCAKLIVLAVVGGLVLDSLIDGIDAEQKEVQSQIDELNKKENPTKEDLKKLDQLQEKMGGLECLKFDAYMAKAATSVSFDKASALTNCAKSLAKLSVIAELRQEEPDLEKIAGRNEFIKGLEALSTHLESLSMANKFEKNPVKAIKEEFLSQTRKTAQENIGDATEAAGRMFSTVQKEFASAQDVFFQPSS